MVKKLRKKFVITATLSLLAILVVMIAIINFSNILSNIREADHLLSILSTNDGHFPQTHPPKENRFDPGNAISFERLNITKSAEMPFQSRFFVVWLDESVNVSSTDLSQVAAISEEDAVKYGQLASNSGKEKGMIQSYRYLKATSGNGSKFIIFVDMTVSLINIYNLLIRSVLVGLLALLAMFILVFMFSTHAVAPVVESLEKQKRFITDAGHELKTPLAVISANIDVLELESGKNEWTSSIRNQIKRMNSLVKNLLTLSRMDEERMRVVFSDFNLSNTVSEAATSFQALAESKGKSYQIDIEKDIHITGDQKSLEQPCQK